MNISTATRSPQSLSALPAPALPALIAPALPVAHSSGTSRHPRRLWQSAMPEITLSVVIPFYNPGDALRPTVERLLDVLNHHGVTFEVIAVSDGSTDGSEDTLAGLDDRVTVLVAPFNRGKGAALRLGMEHAAGAWVGFLDADGDIDPVHLSQYLRLAQAGDHQVVYANKRDPRSGNPSTKMRRVISWTFSSVVSTLFSVGVSDTQTGCKLIRRDVLAQVLPATCEEGFAFDLEFFVAARAAGVSDMVGAPVQLSERLSGSTVTTKAIIRTLKDTLRVFGRRRLTRAYTPTTSSPLFVATQETRATSIALAA